MIAALRGTVTHWDEVTSTAWVEVQGVSYEVRIPAFAGEWVASVLGQADTTIYTFYYVSERSPAPLLIGFQYLQERDFFRKFIEVPGVGPVTAVRALTFPVSDIARWIEAEDTKAVQQLAGIGARTAQTIVATLAGKLTQEALLRTSTGEGGGTRVEEVPDLREDAIDALISLQYSRRDAERAVADAMRARSDFAGLEDLLRMILEQQSPA